MAKRKRLTPARTDYLAAPAAPRPAPGPLSSAPIAQFTLLVTPVALTGRVCKVSPVPERETRSVIAEPSPLSRAMTCSIGPPGAVWMITKLITMIASNVGMISSRRRMM